ncbi:phage tail assembly protein [Arthrobacter sp. 31Y]|uniref:phage tail assembly protein n=1 Tax=Arthrobacter sp. 31Y TaxID=1115632 RepID=UPI0004669422|nr:phage tail assembly protein [Arthrobacter sp. 31Y]
MTQVTLADVQNAAAKKHGNYSVFVDDDTLTFLNPLRLPKEKRERIAALNSAEFYAEGAEGEGWDKWDMYQEIFRISAKSEEHFTKLHNAIGDDPAVWEELFDALNTVAELGEASPSES